MPETRYRPQYEYPKGLTSEEKTLDKAIITRIPYEVSDEELAEEQIERDSNDAIHDIKYKHDNWDDLTSNQQKAVVRSLLTCMLNLYQGQY